MPLKRLLMHSPSSIFCKTNPRFRVNTTSESSSRSSSSLHASFMVTSHYPNNRVVCVRSPDHLTAQPMTIAVLLWGRQLWRQPSFHGGLAIRPTSAGTKPACRHNWRPHKVGTRTVEACHALQQCNPSRIPSVIVAHAGGVRHKKMQHSHNVDSGAERAERAERDSLK